MRPRFKKIVSFAVVICFTWLTGFQGAEAKLVDTSKISEGVQVKQERERINVFLEREEVKTQLETWGLTSQEAENRVASLTEEEVTFLAQQLDQLPAGGDGVGAIVGAAVLIFLVLLITDILGFTDVFRFVKKH